MPAVAQDTRDNMVDIAKMSGSVTVPSFQLPTLPKQLQRITPACIALLVLFVLFSSQLGDFGSKVFVSRSTPFPRKIWQTWKVDPLDFEERDLNTARSWTRQNPSYRYEVLTDQNDQAWVENAFGPNGYNRLDIIYMYRELTAKIIKADILRYLVMYVEGGVYADIDVEDLRPIEHFVPERYQEGDVDMVLGVEIDQPEFSDHPILGPKSQSFCQWTFMSKPGQPVMLQLVENIMRWLKDVAEEQKVPIGEIKLDFDQVISGTGPSAFTRAVLDEMSKRTGKTVTWDTFHNINESKLVGGILVLTVEAFAAGQGHSDSGNHDTKHAIVRHHYHASKWPDSHPRYKHPIFGQVEDCNWKPDCVKKWDEDTAAFKGLSPEEQTKQIAVFEANKEKEETKA
jgi:mannosyltransferase OCH1-like enzyme